MNDANRDAAERLKPLDQFSLGDLESIRLILRGDSIIDWRRLDFTEDEQVRRLYLGRNFELKRKDYLHDEAKKVEDAVLASRNEEADNLANGK